MVGSVCCGLHRNFPADRLPRSCPVPGIHPGIRCCAGRTGSGAGSRRGSARSDTWCRPKSSTNCEGTIPISTSMIRPMPFCAIVGAVDRADGPRPRSPVPGGSRTAECSSCRRSGGAVPVSCASSTADATDFQADQHQGSDQETGLAARTPGRRRLSMRLLPVHSVGQRDIVDQRVGQAHAEDRADQRAGTGRRDTEVPGAQVPGNGRCEQRKHRWPDPCPVFTLICSSTGSLSERWRTPPPHRPAAHRGN